MQVLPRLPKLSPREQAILNLASEGLIDTAIATQLGISEATVRTYWGRIRIKLGPYSRTELVAMLLRSEAEATVQSLRRQIELLSNKLSVAELAVQNSKKAPRDKPSAEWRINYSREDEESATENLSALMSLLSQGVLVAEERSGAIKRFNAAACDIFDYLPQEMAQLRFKDLVPANFGRPRAAQDPKSIGLRKGIPLGVQRQVSGLRRDGSRLDMDLALTSTKRKDAIIAVFSKCEVA